MSADSASDEALARSLVHDVGTGALATLLENGAPFASYVTTAPAADGSPLLLLSDLAMHSRNIARDPRASLLYVRAPDPEDEAMTAVRLTLTGRLIGDDDAELSARYLAAHPEAARYAGFADFSLYRFHIAAGHLVAGFGRIVSLTPADLLSAPA